MMKKLFLALVLMFVLVPFCASAESVTLDIGSIERLDIMPDGYSTGDLAASAPVVEHPFTGEYVITGMSYGIDTALDFYNYSGKPVVYNVTFRDLGIDSASWSTAIRFNGNADITLNITNIGYTHITTWAHPAFKAADLGSAKLTINVKNTLGSTFTCFDFWGRGNHTYGSDGNPDNITFTINNKPVSGKEAVDESHFEHEWEAVWTPDVSWSMTESSFLNNRHGVVCVFTCDCGKQIKVSELQSMINEDGTGTYFAALNDPDNPPAADTSITYTFVEEMPATGDSAQPLMWSMLLAVSAIALLTMRKSARSH